MSKLDRLILVELFGPWAFGVAIFTTLIMAGSLLFTLTNYLVSGAPFTLIAELTALLVPGVMVKTFSMAVLLSTLLGFGRLSSDSEIVAIRAAGASLPRMMVPVACFGIVVAIIAFVVNEKFVSYASAQAEAVKSDIQKHLKGSATSTAFMLTNENGDVKGQLMAKGFDLSDKTLTDVVIAIYDSQGNPDSILTAKKVHLEGNPTDINNAKWVMPYGADLVKVDGTYKAHLGRVYPVDMVPPPPKPVDIMASTLKDLDALSMGQTRAAITKLQKDPSVDPKNIANLWYGYYNKLALPLSAVIFGLVGAPLSIRGHRTGTATGFWLSVIIIFAYMMLANLMNIYAMGQKIPPYVASFTPLAIGLVFAVGLIYRKNR